MATPVFWESNINSASEHRDFPNSDNPPRQLLQLDVMFDNSIPDSQSGCKDRDGFWCSVEQWHQDARCFIKLFAKDIRVKVEGRVIMDHQPDKESGEKVQALKVEASRVPTLPHRLTEATLLPSTDDQSTQHQQSRRIPPQPAQQDAHSQQDYDSAFDDNVPMQQATQFLTAHS